MLRSAATLLLTATVLSTLVHGDVLIAENGDRVTGRLLYIENGFIHFQSETFGELRVPEGRAIVEMSASSEVAAATSGPEGSTELAEGFQVGSAPSAAAGEFGGEEAAASRNPWTRQIEFGLMNQSGITKHSNYSLNLDISRKFGEHDQLSFLASHYYGKSGKVVSSDSTTASANFRKGISDTFFVNSTTRYAQDGIKKLDHEAGQAVGIGMQIFDRERLKFDLGAGAGVRHQEYADSDGRWDALIDGFQSMTLALNDRITIRQRLAMNAVPDGDNDVQVRFRAALVSSLTEALDMSLRYEYDYDGKIRQNIRNVERIITSIGYAF